MFLSFAHRPKFALVRKVVSSIMTVAFLTSLSAPAGAQLASLLPTPGSAVTISPVFVPPTLKGLNIHPENPFLFDFIVGRGDDKIEGTELKAESEKLVKFFLTAMTIPDKEAWVNLSPYEANRIIPDALGKTEMGKVMLEQDYLLKQLASSLTNPDTDLGKKFWNDVRAKAKEKFGTTDIPMSTFNKVWIVPSKAEVAEKDGKVFITKNSLKVMLEEDYQALESQQALGRDAGAPATADAIQRNLSPTAEQNLTPPNPLFKKEGEKGNNSVTLSSNKTISPSTSSLDKTKSLLPPSLDTQGEKGNNSVTLSSNKTISPSTSSLDKTKSLLPPSLDKEGVGGVLKPSVQPPTSSLSSEVFRSTILPTIEKEINEGKNFAAVRQIYDAAILAVWYKSALKESLLGKIYADKSKVKGIETDAVGFKEEVYKKYVEAFKKGAYNIIKEDFDMSKDEAVPTRYFSGGMYALPKLVERKNGVPVSALEADDVVVEVLGTEGPETFVVAQGAADSAAKSAASAVTEKIDVLDLAIKVESNATDSASSKKAVISALDAFIKNGKADKELVGALGAISKGDGYKFNYQDKLREDKVFFEVTRLMQELTSGNQSSEPAEFGQFTDLQEALYKYRADILNALQKNLAAANSAGSAVTEKIDELEKALAVSEKAQRRTSLPAGQIDFGVKSALESLLKDPILPKALLFAMGREIIRRDEDIRSLLSDISFLADPTKFFPETPEGNRMWEQALKLADENSRIILRALKAYANSAEELPLNGSDLDERILNGQITQGASVREVRFMIDGAPQVYKFAADGSQGKISNIVSRFKPFVFGQNSTDEEKIRTNFIAGGVFESVSPTMVRFVVAELTEANRNAIKEITGERFETFMASFASLTRFDPEVIAIRLTGIAQDIPIESITSIIVASSSAVEDNLDKYVMDLRAKNLSYKKMYEDMKIRASGMALAQLSETDKLFLLFFEDVNKRVNTLKAEGQSEEQAINVVLEKEVKRIQNIQKIEQERLAQIAQRKQQLRDEISQLLPSIIQKLSTEVQNATTSLSVAANQSQRDAAIRSEIQRQYDALKAGVEKRVRQINFGKDLATMHILPGQALRRAISELSLQDQILYQLFPEVQKQMENMTRSNPSANDKFDRALKAATEGTIQKTIAASSALTQEEIEEFRLQAEAKLRDDLGFRLDQNPSMEDVVDRYREIAEGKSYPGSEQDSREAAVDIRMSEGLSDNDIYDSLVDRRIPEVMRVAGIKDSTFQEIEDILSAGKTALENGLGLDLIDPTQAGGEKPASSPLKPVGGINFDPTLMNLQVKRDKNGVPLPVFQQDLPNINIEGLYPVIINIAPATMANFPLLSKAEEEKQRIPSAKDDLSPLDRQKLVGRAG